MKNVPNEIWLNLGFDKEEANSDLDFHDLNKECVTWSNGMINTADIKYVHNTFVESLKRTIDNQQRANKMLVDQVMRLSIYEELIDFAVFLTGHDRETIEQMHNNWKNTK